MRQMTREDTGLTITIDGQREVDSVYLCVQGDGYALDAILTHEDVSRVVELFDARDPKKRGDIILETGTVLDLSSDGVGRRYLLVLSYEHGLFIPISWELYVSDEEVDFIAASLVEERELNRKFDYSYN